MTHPKLPKASNKPIDWEKMEKLVKSINEPTNQTLRESIERICQDFEGRIVHKVTDKRQKGWMINSTFVDAILDLFNSTALERAVKCLPSKFWEGKKKEERVEGYNRAIDHVEDRLKKEFKS